MTRYFPKYFVQAVMGAAGSGSLTAAILWFFVHLPFWPTFGVVFALYLIAGLVRAVSGTSREREFDLAARERNRQETERAGWPSRQLTLSDGLKVEFRRKPDGAVHIRFAQGVDYITANAWSRRLPLELTKVQLRESESDLWYPNEVDAAWWENDLEDKRTDEHGRDVRSLIVQKALVTFTRESDGVTLTRRSPGKDQVPAGYWEASDFGLIDLVAPLELTKLQLRRGEVPWYPAHVEEAKKALNQVG